MSLQAQQRQVYYKGNQQFLIRFGAYSTEGTHVSYYKINQKSMGKEVIKPSADTPTIVLLNEQDMTHKEYWEQIAE